MHSAKISLNLKPSMIYSKDYLLDLKMQLIKENTRKQIPSNPK